MQTEEQGSRIVGFGRLEHDGRLEALAARTGLGAAELEALRTEVMAFEAADHMIENAVGVLGLPLGIGLNFRINGRDRLVPMAVEEPSVVAAASSAARLAREAGGFEADADPGVMIGQILLIRVPDVAAARLRIEQAAPRLMAAADAVHPNMVRRGGGARGIEVRVLPDAGLGGMLAVDVLLDCGDAMGANAVNTVVEALAPAVEELTGGEARLRILSNLADRRLARARVRFPFEVLTTRTLPGDTVAARVAEAWALAWVDPYRACTHNKGVMNGIDAVALATGNDWRGIEAGAHAYAVREGAYRPLSTWRVEGGALEGRLEVPLAVATVGGNLELNARARLALRLLGVESARDLAAVMAAVGLAQNFAALRALVTDGIQRGHMALHARGLALAVGASEELADRVVERLIASGEIKLHKAREILAALHAESAARR
ncbi:MAG: hydroxymethylglutaryl-CoA reductase, degradative [bacterium]|nr:hydroxymethylglutaryl-CoA reductase, degradative [bacterium]